MLLIYKTPVYERCLIGAVDSQISSMRVKGIISREFSLL